MERLQNRPLNSNGKAFYNGAYNDIVTRPRFDGIAGYDTRDYDGASEKPVHHQIRMRPVIDDISDMYEVKLEDDQLYSHLRYDMMFSICFGTKTDTSNVGAKEFALQGLNRYLHEAKLEEEAALARGKKFVPKKFDVKFVQQYVHFIGILNSDKSQPMAWGETEKVGVHITVGTTRIPSCFDEISVPPITRLAFLVKEVCVSENQSYVIDVNRPGISLKPPKDGYVTRVIPIAHPDRFLLNECRYCGLPDSDNVENDPQAPLRVCYSNCTHKNHMLLYEVNVTENSNPEAYCESLWTLYCARQRRNGKEIKPLFRITNHKTEETNWQEALKELKKEVPELVSTLPTLISARKAHYIPFAMTEQGMNRTAIIPNVYRPNSEINKAQYQLNEHIEVWLRAE